MRLLQSFMIWVYRILFIPVFLILLPYYLLRMVRRGGYQKGFGQRFGSGDLPPRQKGVRRIWLQAVSVGEIRAMEPLIERLRQQPDLEIVLTTTTSTGYALANERFPDNTILIRYFPIDFWGFSRRTWTKINPDLALLAEGEIWPEHLHQAARRKTPVILLNGRLSDRSFQRFSYFKFWVRRLLGKFSLILAASETDANRFRKLGADPRKITVTGNLKLEIPRAEPLTGDLKREWGKQLGFPISNQTPKVLFGASTWPGEERFLWDLVKEVRKTDPSWVLLLVPRHAERGSSLKREFAAEPDIRFWRDPVRENHPAVIADITGKMRELLRGADLVFVGKSLPPHRGGQTPLEAAAASLPIVCGPHMENFRSLVTEMEQAQALKQADNESQARALLQALMHDDTQRQALGDHAGQWMNSQQGTLDRIWESLSHWLNHNS